MDQKQRDRLQRALTELKRKALETEKQLRTATAVNKTILEISLDAQEREIIRLTKELEGQP